MLIEYSRKHANLTTCCLELISFLLTMQWSGRALPSSNHSYVHASVSMYYERAHIQGTFAPVSDVYILESHYLATRVFLSSYLCTCKT